MKVSSLLLLSLSVLFPSCASMVSKDHGFKETSPVNINGAQVKSALKPMGGKAGFAFSAMIVSAGTGSTDGPFLWRVEAEGQEGVHEWLRVNEARVTTETTKRSEKFPKNLLGGRVPFEKTSGSKGLTFAKFQVPGKLTVFPRTDGKVKIHFNVSVRTKSKTETKWIVFELDPLTKWNTQSIFLPTEVVKSFRGDPRGWDW